jgi:hypothetical protein
MDCGATLATAQVIPLLLASPVLFESLIKEKGSSKKEVKGTMVTVIGKVRTFPLDIIRTKPLLHCTTNLHHLQLRTGGKSTS